ncbi:monocarboxylate transporter 12 [Arapaima gigas]
MKPGGTHHDGGWGWMIVAGCFVVTICTRAVTRCVSIFFLEFQKHFARDYSGTAWIHSLVDCTTMLCAPLGSFIGSQLSCRITVILGGSLAAAGLVLSSFATSLEYLYLSMGILTGAGFALCYTPAIAMVGTYFRERKALAYGIAMSGGGIGTFILAPVVQLLIEYYSWRGALLILGGLVSNMCVCGALMRPLTVNKEDPSKTVLADVEFGYAVKPQDIKPSDLRGKTGQLESTKSMTPSCLFIHSLKEYRFLIKPEFMVLSASILFLAYGCSVPFVYLIPYALSRGISHQQAAFLMSILGIIDIVGNITFGWLTDIKCLKKYRSVSYMVAVGIEGLCCLFIPVLQSFYLLVPFSVLYGYFDGAYVALIPVVTSDVVGTPYISSALGVVYFLHAIPYLISPPIGGWLVDRTGSYTTAFVLSGFSLVCSSLLLSTVALLRWCRKTCRFTTNRVPKLDLWKSNQTSFYMASEEALKSVGTLPS